MSEQRTGPDLVEIVGAVLLLGWVFWVGLVTLVRQPQPSSTLLVVFVVPAAMLAAGYVLGRWRLPSTPVELSVAALALAALVLIVTTLLDGRAGGQPTGYANANAAVAVQLSAMLGLVATRVGDGPRRRGLLVLAVATFALTAANRSVFGLLCGLGVLVLLVLPGLARRLGRWAVALGVLVGLTATAALVAVAAQRPWAGRLAALVDPVRRDLWHLAFTVWRGHPVTGSGVGAFAAANPYAVDADTAMAHSTLLQTAAEAGLVGVAGLVAIAALGFATTLRARGGVAALASAAWAAVCAHALVDHVTDYPLVLFTAGITLAMARALAHAGEERAV